MGCGAGGTIGAPAAVAVGAVPVGGWHLMAEADAEGVCSHEAGGSLSGILANEEQVLLVAAATDGAGKGFDLVRGVQCQGHCVNVLLVDGYALLALFNSGALGRQGKGEGGVFRGVTGVQTCRCVVQGVVPPARCHQLRGGAPHGTLSCTRGMCWQCPPIGECIGSGKGACKSPTPPVGRPRWRPDTRCIGRSRLALRHQHHEATSLMLLLFLLVLLQLMMMTMMTLMSTQQVIQTWVMKLMLQQLHLVSAYAAAAGAGAAGHGATQGTCSAPRHAATARGACVVRSTGSVAPCRKSREGDASGVGRQAAAQTGGRLTT